MNHNNETKFEAVLATTTITIFIVIMIYLPEILVALLVRA